MNIRVNTCAPTNITYVTGKYSRIAAGFVRSVTAVSVSGGYEVVTATGESPLRWVLFLCYNIGLKLTEHRYFYFYDTILMNTWPSIIILDNTSVLYSYTD